MKKPVYRNLHLSLSDRCNLNCSFCYTKGGCGTDFNRDHIDKCFDWFFKQYNEGASDSLRKKGVRICFMEENH